MITMNNNQKKELRNIINLLEEIIERINAIQSDDALSYAIDDIEAAISDIEDACE